MLRVVVVLCTLLAWAQCQTAGVGVTGGQSRIFPTFADGEYDDCQALWASLAINMTKAPYLSMTAGTIITIKGKATFGGWAKRATLPNPCVYEFRPSSWELGQQLSFRLISLKLPSGSPGAQHWRFRVQSQAVTGGSLTDVFTASLASDGRTYSTSPNWVPGSQTTFQTAGSQVPAVPACTFGTDPGCPGKKLTFTLDYDTGLAPLSDAEINAPSVASFVAEVVLTHDQCPATDNMYWPSNGPVIPFLRTCAFPSVANKSCCDASSEIQVAALDTGDFRGKRKMLAPAGGIIPDRDSSCYQHYHLAACNVRCQPKAVTYFYRNVTTNEYDFVLCNSYCANLLKECGGAHLWSSADWPTSSPLSSRNVSQLFSDPVAFCLTYFQGVAGAGIRVRVADNLPGNNGAPGCFDASLVGSGAAANVSLLVVLLSLVLSLSTL